eukprot:3295775-Ditylum_brightwellii.AAC.1
MMTQKKGAEAYLHLWDPAHQLVNIEHGTPSLSWIIQDMDQVTLEGEKGKELDQEGEENIREAKIMKKGVFILMQKK